MKHAKRIRNAYFTPMIRPVVVIYFRVVNRNPRRIVPSMLWPVQFVSFHIQNVKEVWKFSNLLKNLQLWLNGKRIFSNTTQLNCVTLPNGQGSFMTQLLETMISISGIVMGTASIDKNAMPSYSTDTKQNVTLEIWRPKNVYFLKDRQLSRNCTSLVAVSFLTARSEASRSYKRLSCCSPDFTQKVAISAYNRIYHDSNVIQMWFKCDSNVMQTWFKRNSKVIRK